MKIKKIIKKKVLLFISQQPLFLYAKFEKVNLSGCMYFRIYQRNVFPTFKPCMPCCQCPCKVPTCRIDIRSHPELYHKSDPSVSYSETYQKTYRPLWKDRRLRTFLDLLGLNSCRLSGCNFSKCPTFLNVQLYSPEQAKKLGCYYMPQFLLRTIHLLHIHWSFRYPQVFDVLELITRPNLKTFQTIDFVIVSCGTFSTTTECEI